MASRNTFPVHPVPASAHARAARPAEIAVSGLVERAGSLSASSLEAMAREQHAGDFSCREGWTVEGVRWEGIRLGVVLEAAGVLPDARYVRVVADDYVLPLAIEEAGALLCDTLNGEPLALEHGAPWRLLLPDGECFSSVKWVERIEVTAEPGENTAQAIASARLA